MRFNIHAGHGADGSKSCGAIGIIKESTEARKVKEEVIRLLRQEGHTVFDCTVDYPSGQSDCLNKIVAKCNANRVDLNVSIHFNSGAKDEKGNGRTTGVEVLVYNNKTSDVADRICNNISKLGYKNRGIKTEPRKAVLRRTVDKSILVECCFVDDLDDVKIYNYKTMAKAIVEGILGKSINTTKTEPKVEKDNVKNYAIVYDNNVDKTSAEIISWGVPHSKTVDIKDFTCTYWGVVAVGESVGKKIREKYPKINFTHISGKDRYDTVKLALKYIGK